MAILVGDDRTAALALRRLDDVDDQMDGAQEGQRILCVAVCGVSVSGICQDLASLQNSRVYRRGNETLCVTIQLVSVLHMWRHDITSQLVS